MATVVNERMLAGEGKSSWAHTTFLKDLAVVMESPESVVKGIQCILREDAFPCNITKIQECCESLDDADGDKPFECGDENLFCLSGKT